MRRSNSLYKPCPRLPSPHPVATIDQPSNLHCRALHTPHWEYLSALTKVQIVVDNVDETLASLSLKEANAVISNECEEVRGAHYDGQIRDSGDIDVFVPSQLELFKDLLSNSVLEKVQEAINRVLV